jgi:hypothetical protein
MGLSPGSRLCSGTEAPLPVLEIQTGYVLSSMALNRDPPYTQSLPRASSTSRQRVFAVHRTLSIGHFDVRLPLNKKSTDGVMSCILLQGRHHLCPSFSFSIDSLPVLKLHEMQSSNYYMVYLCNYQTTSLLEARRYAS